MYQTIIDLWNGNIAPFERCGVHDPAIRELHALIARNREDLTSGLTAAQMETFQKSVNYSDQYLLRMMELAFCDGFTLGSKLAAEAFR